MDFIKQYPLFSAFIAICTIAFGVEIALTVMFVMNSNEGHNNYKKAISARKQVIAMSPKPTEENLEKSKNNIVELQNNLQEKIRTISANSNKDIAEGMPTGPNSENAMYFKMTKFIEHFKELAVNPGEDENGEPKSKIRLGDDEFSFGFGYFVGVHRGPPKSAMRNVYVQFQVLNYLLKHLFDAGPHSIVAVERNAVSVAVDGSETQDFFAIRDNVTAAIPNAIDTQSFRFKFSGYTSSLRYFLNAISKYEWPLSVRSVRVETSREIIEEDEDAGLEGVFGVPEEEDEEAQDPIVENNVSEFEVIVELIEINAQFSKKEEPSEEN